MRPPPRRTQLQIRLAVENPLARAYLKRILGRKGWASLSHPNETRNLKVDDSSIRVVYLIDPNGPPGSAARFVASMNSGSAPWAAAALYDQEVEEEIFELLPFGIRAVVPYEEVDSQLIPALTAVARGDVWIPQALLQRYIVYGRRDVRRQISDRVLTKRQQQVMELICRRLSNKEIAAVLNISESAVKFHLAKLFLKCHAHNRVDLAYRAAGLGHPNIEEVAQLPSGDPESAPESSCNSCEQRRVGNTNTRDFTGRPA